MARGLRVAVAGASGIGRHHAKWHHLAGNEVVGFLGSSRASCEQTSQRLKEIFPFAGKGYWEWDQLLEQARPEAIDICLPNHLHGEMALKAMKADCHVLCEKPLVWLPGAPFESILAEACQLVEIARKRGMTFGVCTQYAAALPHYLQLYEAECGLLQSIDTFYAEMETLARGRQRSAAEVWIDMGPHPLSLLLAWIPDGAIADNSLQVEFQGREARAVFDFISSQGICRSELVVRDLEAGQPTRRFGVNGFIVDCEGRPDAQGVFRCVLSHGGKEVMGEDFLSLLIAQFDEVVKTSQGIPLVPGEVGLRNLELQIQILRQAQG